MPKTPEPVWDEAPDAPPRSLSIEHLHPEVISAASHLFADCHYASSLA
jgi:hypothetical protein